MPARRFSSLWRGRITVTGAGAALVHGVGGPGAARWPDGAGGGVPVRRSGRSAGRPVRGCRSGLALGAVLAVALASPAADGEVDGAQALLVFQDRAEAGHEHHGDVVAQAVLQQ